MNAVLQIRSALATSRRHSEQKDCYWFAPNRSGDLHTADQRPAAYYDSRDGGRRLEVMRWGLIPYWAKDVKIVFSTINARAEEVDTKPAFREAFRQRRCLVPLDSFYEWKKTTAGKQPYAIALKDRRLMGMAGLWETWRSLLSAAGSSSPAGRGSGDNPGREGKAAR